MMKTKPTLVVFAALGIGLAPCAQARDTDHPVQYLHLQNNGSYTISDIELKWITPEGEKKSNTFTNDLQKSRGFCLDLKKFGDVDEGSEVWLKAYIALGDKESCRKDNPRIYDASLGGNIADKTQLYKMGGTTLNNNSCKLSSGLESNLEDTNDTGNSTDCPTG